MGLELIFLGTGTSAGVPEIGCDCEICASKDPLDKRLRTSVYLQQGNTSFIIDASLDLRQQFLREGIKSLDAVLFTHTHADHVLGLDDLRSITKRQERPIHVYATEYELNEIKRIFPYMFGNLLQEGGGVVQITANPISYDNFFVGEVKIRPLKAMHGIYDITGYLINNKLAYITDASHLPNETMELISNVDTLILNTLRNKSHSTHFNIEQSLDIVKKIKPKHTYFVHMNHEVLHQKVQNELPENVFLAYDGLKLQG